VSCYPFLSIQPLKERGYAVDLDLPQPEVKKASKQGVIKSFARQSRRGYTDLSSTEKVEAAFMESVEYLCKLGYKRNSLKTGSCGMDPLAMPIQYAADAQLGLLPRRGFGGGTGMSAQNMMECWRGPRGNCIQRCMNTRPFLQPRASGLWAVMIPCGFCVWRKRGNHMVCILHHKHLHEKH
jgi:hypothetical protein